MSNQKEPANRKSRWIVIIAFVVLLVALGVCVAMLLAKSGPNAEPEPEKTAAQKALERGFVDQDSIDDIMEEMSDKVAEGMFECRMSTTWTFEDSKSVSPNAYVANVESNRNTLYFDVYEKSTNELLYSSPMLPVGTEFREVKLDKEMPAGEYEAVVMYTLVDEDYEEVSTVGFSIMISVLH